MPDLEEAEMVQRSYQRSCAECPHGIPAGTRHLEVYGRKGSGHAALHAICDECREFIYRATLRDPEFDWPIGNLDGKLKEDFPDGV